MSNTRDNLIYDTSNIETTKRQFRIRKMMVNKLEKIDLDDINIEHYKNKNLRNHKIIKHIKSELFTRERIFKIFIGYEVCCNALRCLQNKIIIQAISSLASSLYLCGKVKSAAFTNISRIDDLERHFLFYGANFDIIRRIFYYDYCCKDKNNIMYGQIIAAAVNNKKDSIKSIRFNDKEEWIKYGRTNATNTNNNDNIINGHEILLYPKIITSSTTNLSYHRQPTNTQFNPRLHAQDGDQNQNNKILLEPMIISEPSIIINNENINIIGTNTNIDDNSNIWKGNVVKYHIIKIQEDDDWSSFIINISYVDQFGGTLGLTFGEGGICGLTSIAAANHMASHPNQYIELIQNILSGQTEDIDPTKLDLLFSNLKEEDIIETIKTIKEIMMQNNINCENNNPLSWVCVDDIEWLAQNLPTIDPDNIKYVIGNLTQIEASINEGEPSIEYEILEQLNQNLRVFNGNTSRTGTIVTQTSENPLYGRHFITLQTYTSLSHEINVTINLNSALSTSSNTPPDIAPIIKLNTMIDNVDCINISSLISLKILHHLRHATRCLLPTTKQYEYNLIGSLNMIIDNNFGRYSVSELELDDDEFDIDKLVKQAKEDWEFHDLEFNDKKIANIANNVEKYYDNLQYGTQDKIRTFIHREKYTWLKLLSSDWDTLLKKDNSMNCNMLVCLYSVFMSLAAYIFSCKFDLVEQVLPNQIKQLDEFIEYFQTHLYTNIGDDNDDDDDDDDNNDDDDNGDGDDALLGTSKNCKICKEECRASCDYCHVKIHSKCYDEQMNFPTIATLTSVIFCFECQSTANQSNFVSLASPLLKY